MGRESLGQKCNMISYRKKVDYFKLTFTFYFPRKNTFMFKELATLMHVMGKYKYTYVQHKM